MNLKISNFDINEILFLNVRMLPELRYSECFLNSIHSEYFGADATSSECFPSSVCSECFLNSIHSVNMPIRALGCSHVFSILLFIEITSLDEEAFKTLNYKHSNIRIGNIYLIIMNLDT